MNLSLRLYLLLGVIVTVALIGATWSLVDEARSAVTDEMQSTLDLTTTLVEGLVAQPEIANTRPHFTRLIESIRARHVDIEVRARAMSQRPQTLRTVEAPAWFVALVRPDATALAREVMVPSTALTVAITADPADEIEESWRECRRNLLILLLLAAGMTTLFARWGTLALRPLGEISQAMAQIAAGKLGARLRNFGISDIDDIVAGFNRMADAQERSAEQDADYAKRGLAIREEERRYLARELHDEMGQSISAIKALAVSISQRSGEVDARIKKSAETIADVSTHVYDRVRQMMSQLHPTTLDELGLQSALEDMVDTWNSHHETVFCAFSVIEPLPTLSRETSINLFRIVQEGLTNIAKHARATEAQVSLRYDEETEFGQGALALTVKDNGVGFEPDTSLRGLGLVGIQERVKALSGKFTLASTPTGGTQFEVIIPVAKEI